MASSSKLTAAGIACRLSAIDVTELFPRSTMTVSLRPDFYPRRYLLDFISMLAPKFNRNALQKAMNAGGSTLQSRGAQAAR